MIKRITIRNIKHIRCLEFNLPTRSGVYTLTGSNGSGKTTLMTCLHRIGWFRAFKDNFKPGKDKFDQYAGNITYQLGDQKVSYRYAGTRWPPTPRSNSQLFSEFGFPEVRFLPATGKRLFIHEDELTSSSIRGITGSLKEDLNELLETTKFDNLRYVQTGSERGPGSGSQRWKRAYVVKKGRQNYYSEKNFSLGEILILNTLLLIDDVATNSMILIDELEMALHPRVQIKLLKYLENKAQEKNLTIIMSTHSSSLIKSSKKIIYLENDGSGKISIKYNCYPTMVLREVAIEEDMQPDYIFFIEDDMASMLLKEMIKYFFQQDTSRLVPIYKVLPIGGYTQVLEFANNCCEYLFNSKIGQYVFLDADVNDTHNVLCNKGNNRNDSEQQLFQLFDRLEQRIKYLPITPELGIWKWITENYQQVQRLMREHYIDSSFNILDLIENTNSYHINESENDRKNAKRKLKHLTTQLESKINENQKRINQFLFQLFISDYYSNTDNTNELKRILSQIFSTRGNRT